MIKDIKTKLLDCQRISYKEAVFLFEKASDEDLSACAQIVKARFHNVLEASYLVMAIINYTNICVAKCDYCAFYRLPHQSGTYLLDLAQIVKKIDELKQYGGTLVSFNGGFHPKLKISDYAELFRSIHQIYPDLAFFEMTVAEFMFSCKLSKISYEEGAEVLKDAGTKWVTGGGSEVLDENFRARHSPGKFKVSDYFIAQKALLKSGIGSTATMVIGFDETLAERMNHLESLRTFQDAMIADGFPLTSFLCWTYKPFHTELGGEEISTQEYLRWLAVSRIYLDNFQHIRTSVLTKNEAALEGLKYGANDFDLPTEDEVTQKAGATIHHDFEKILNTARAQGFNVRHRQPFSIKLERKREVEASPC